MAGLLPAIQVLPFADVKEVDARYISVRKHAIFRTAMARARRLTAWC